MRNLFSFILVITICSSATAQDTIAFSNFNYERNKMSRDGMVVLGGWATANIVTGGIAALSTEPGSQANWFHQMNAYWNVINLAIALPGYFGAKKKMKLQYGPYETIEEQKTVEFVYMLNFGLDIGYIGLGAWMQEFGKGLPDKGGAAMQGIGNSFMLQGGFLMLFDLVSYIIHKRHWNNKKAGLFELLHFNGTSIKLTVPIK